MVHRFTHHPGLGLLSRVLAAVLGGYLLASAWAALVGVTFGSAEAVLAGVQLGFVVHLAAVIWAFSPVPPGRVWRGLLLPAAACASLAALCAHLGG